MPQQQTVWPQANMPLAPGDSRRAVTAQHEARQNHLLAALPLDDFERLLPDLEPVPLPLGWTMHGAGEPEKYLYFITAGVVAKFLVLQDGASAEVAVAGREGVIGLALFLASGIAPTQAMVVSPGYAYRLKADLVKDECRHSGPLPGLMLRYSQALME